MAHSIVHLNPDVFPDPLAFRPERWMRADSQKLERYFVAFGRGPRSCIGIQYVPLGTIIHQSCLRDFVDSLAWSMLYHTVAHIFRKLDLNPVSPDDLRYVPS